MNPRHRVSRAAIELIKRFEGYRRKAAQLPDGRWTIGYGHTLTARQGAEVSEEDAEALLLYDLIAVAHAVNEQTFAPLTQNQFDALCSFAFNIGLDNFRRASVLKRINEGALIQAACAMELWRKADFEGERIVIDALVRRRSAEKTLFLTPPGNAWVPAPSPILRPMIDTDALDMVPRQAPAPVVTSLEGERVLVLREDEPSPAPARPDEEEAASPALAAAEAVTSRLSTIFQEPGQEPEYGPPADSPWEEPEPQGAASPAAIDVIAHEESAAEEPFELTPPDTDDETPEGPVLRTPAEADQGPGPDLFDRPTPANDVGGEAAAEAAEAEREADARVVIDDTVPYEFIAPPVQPLPRQPKDGAFSMVAFAVLGLAFFAGGVFWAVYARPDAQGGMVNPVLVGMLAGVAGVGLVAIAVYMLLERLGRASERSGDRPRI